MQLSWLPRPTSETTDTLINFCIIHDSLQPFVPSQPMNFLPHLSFQRVQNRNRISERFSRFSKVFDGIHFECRRGRTFLKYVWSKLNELQTFLPRLDCHVLMIFLPSSDCFSVLTPCTTGNENFPSVRSSAKPLLDVYVVLTERFMRSSRI